MKKISKKLILLIAIIMLILAINSKSVYGYLTSRADTTSNAIGTDFYGGINTKLTCTVIGKNEAKITLKNNGSLTCKSKIKILLPNDVTYTISDSKWIKDGEDWVNYNNVINSQETVELNINLNVPSNKETKFNINVIEKTEPADTNSEINLGKRKIVTNRALTTSGMTITTGSIATAISQGENIIASRFYNSSEDKFEEVNNEWNIANETLKIGKKYQPNLRVYNPEGGIDEYARATIYLRLVDEAGNIIIDQNIYKKIEDAIEIEYDENWIYDEGAAATGNTGIRKVLYHSKIIESGKYTSNFLSGIALNGKILNAKSATARTENSGTVNTITYDLEGMKLQIEVQVDTVQTHSAKDAIKSVWGRDVEIAPDRTLSLL